MDLSRALLAGERAAIAKAISIIEDETLESRDLIKKIFSKVGRARIIGITGPAGAGKSTLIGQIIGEYRAEGFKVGVLAVDPTSAISGGAILGDRVRMQRHALDEEIFIRSMASRGATGGLSRAVRNAARVLDAAGFERIVIESVGAGQLDIDIANISDVTIVVFNPQTGDSIQAVKAGLTEVGDIYVINKADLRGASKLFSDVRDLIADTERKPLIFKTVASTGKGVKELVKGIENILELKSSSYKELERRRTEIELRDLVLDMTRSKIIELIKKDERYEEYIKDLLDKRIDPYTAASELASRILR